jgi:hypothetical protein
MSSRVGSFDELIAFLGAEGASFRIDATAQIVQLSTRAPAHDGALFLRWDRDLAYVQIVATLLRDVPEDRLREVVDAVTRLNHALPLPGFGMDLGRRQVYFRVTLIAGEDGLPVEVLKRGVLTAVGNARDLAGPLARVVDGEPGARILALVLEAERARRAERAREAGALFSE